MRRAASVIPARPAARGPARARAFTLLELLVAMAMAAIIAGSLYSALRIGFRARASAEAAVEPVRTAELATALLRADFESAVPTKGTLSGPFVGTDSTGQEGLPADNVVFYTLGDPADAYAATGQAAGAGAGAYGVAGTSSGMAAATGNGATGNAVPSEPRKVEIGLVTYPGPDGRAEQVLVRRVTTNLLAQVEVQGDEEVLCRGVRSLNLRYYDGYTWQDNWDSTQADNNIPAAVELVLELDRSRDGQQQVIRFPRVYLLSCSTVTSATSTGAAGTGGATGGTP